MVNPSDILIRPIITEKAGAMKELKKYAFQVSDRTNKIEIARAVEMQYKVEVDKVNVVSMKPKKKRIRSRIPGFTKSWKKAVVTLKKGEIDFYKV